MLSQTQAKLLKIVIGRAQHELTPSKRQKAGPGKPWLFYRAWLKGNHACGFPYQRHHSCKCVLYIETGHCSLSACHCTRFPYALFRINKQTHGVYTILNSKCREIMSAVLMTSSGSRKWKWTTPNFRTATEEWKNTYNLSCPQMA